ncbi:hypothetical protein BaRGS_00027492 [Batillaria attramentaria]|uniref:C2H2-type domain-containing protein n=1 Tax=Batillaria attramentaria TaxID=370345 RepID=A0ABD0K391_9CAEN
MFSSERFPPGPIIDVFGSRHTSLQWLMFSMWVVSALWRRRVLPKARPGGGVTQTGANKGRATYSCRTCGKVFLHQCNLFRHRKKCEGDFHLTCHVCGMKFYRRDHYQGHLAYKHQTVDVMKGKIHARHGQPRQQPPS